MNTRFFRPRLAVIPLALATAFSAFAQTPTPQAQLRETVVTANRSEQSLADALPHTTVIGREAIERTQAVDLATLLAGEAGFQSTQAGGRGTATSLFLRGSAALQVLVMIDGVPLTKQDATGTVSLEHIMLDQIERVEIVRGNVSAIYGSGAVGGVIQLFTRKGQGAPAGYGQVEAGSFQTGRLSVGYGGQVGDTRFSFGVAGHSTQGISAMNTLQHPNENPDADGYTNVNYSLALSQLLAPGQTLGLRAQGTQGRFDADGGGFGTPTDVYKGGSTLGSIALYSHNQFLKDWRSELTLSTGREKSTYDAEQTSFPYNSEAITRTRTLNWTNIMAWQGWQFTAGAERQLQSIDTSDSTATTLSKERGVTALFAGAATRLDAHSLQANVRYDDVSGYTTQTTGYLGYGYQFTSAWKGIASVSSAFNLPPLGYLYDPFSGNPQLQPETAKSAELGLQWAQDTNIVRATWFNTKTDNLMLYDFSTYSFGNIARSSNQGLEVSYSGHAVGADWRASFTAQDPVNEATGQQLVRRARTMATVGVSVPWGAWLFGADVRYTGERPDTVSNPVLPAYAVTNVTARYAVSRELAVTARIENLFNRDYQTAWGYNQPGIGAYVGLVWAQK